MIIHYLEGGVKAKEGGGNDPGAGQECICLNLDHPSSRGRDRGYWASSVFVSGA